MEHVQTLLSLAAGAANTAVQAAPPAAIDAADQPTGSMAAATVAETTGSWGDVSSGGSDDGNGEKCHAGDSGAAAIDEQTSGKMCDANGRRRRLTIDETRILVEIFQENPKPTNQFRAQLAAEMGLPSRALQIWFQNRRAKLKRAKQDTQQALAKMNAANRHGNSAAWHQMNPAVPFLGGIASNDRKQSIAPAPSPGSVASMMLSQHPEAPQPMRLHRAFADEPLTPEFAAARSMPLMNQVPYELDISYAQQQQQHYSMPNLNSAGVLLSPNDALPRQRLPPPPLSVQTTQQLHFNVNALEDMRLLSATEPSAPGRRSTDFGMTSSEQSYESVHSQHHYHLQEQEQPRFNLQQQHPHKQARRTGSPSKMASLIDDSGRLSAEFFKLINDAGKHSAGAWDSDSEQQPFEPLFTCDTDLSVVLSPATATDEDGSSWIPIMSADSTATLGIQPYSRTSPHLRPSKSMLDLREYASLFPDEQPAKRRRSAANTL